jgi:hypothetical protein
LIKDTYQCKIDEICTINAHIQVSKETIERNYKVMKLLLNVVPENVLAMEEPVLKKMHTINNRLKEDTIKLYSTDFNTKCDSSLGSL